LISFGAAFYAQPGLAQSFAPNALQRDARLAKDTSQACRALIAGIIDIGNPDMH